MRLNEFLARHAVFTVDELDRFLSDRGLRQHLHPQVAAGLPPQARPNRAMCAAAYMRQFPGVWIQKPHRSIRTWWLPG